MIATIEAFNSSSTWDGRRDEVAPVFTGLNVISKGVKRHGFQKGVVTPCYIRETNLQGPPKRLPNVL